MKDTLQQRKMLFSGNYSCGACIRLLFLILLTTAMMTGLSGITNIIIGGESPRQDNNAYAASFGVTGKIAFGVFEGAGNIACGGDIIIMNPDGTDPALLPGAGCGSSPSFSPDGTRLVFDRPGWDYDAGVMGGSQIAALNVDGTDYKILSPADKTTWDGSPSFSPDGTKIVFTRQLSYAGKSNIYVMNADRSGIAKQITNYTMNDFSPSFSPDGTKIVFTRASEIYTMNADDGSNQINLTNNTVEHDIDPSFSPDGTKIAFASNRDSGNWDIYVMNAKDGTQLKRLTNSPFTDTEPVWSPDGTKIAFSSSRDKDGPHYEIYTMNAYDGSNQTRITRFNDISHDPLPGYSPPSWGPSISLSSSSSSNSTSSVDRSPPSVQVSAPVNGSSFTLPRSSNILVYGTAYDVGSGLDRVEVSFDSGAFQKASGNMAWRYSIPAASLVGVSEGVHHITVKATDAAGNISISTSTITIKMIIPPSPPPTTDTAVIPATVTENIVVSDRSSCQALSVHNQTTTIRAASSSTTIAIPTATTALWDSASKTCTIDHGTLTVTKSGSLTIPTLVTLKIAKSVTLQNNGTINSSGTIENDGEVKNFGIINTAGILKNHGSLENSGILNNSNTIDNFGVINNNSRNNSSSHSESRLANSGYINIYGKLGGRITGSGTIVNSGRILTH